MDFIYSLSLQVLVKDHLDKPVDRIRVRLVERQLWRQGDVIEDLPCPDSSISQSDGLAVFICNTPPEAIKTVLKVRGGWCLLVFVYLYLLTF